MHSQDDHETRLPGWLWFFLILPIGLIVLLLYRQRRIPSIAQLKQYLPNQPPRYREPDSIPLNMYREDSAGFQAGGLDTHIDVARMDAESPATANESSDIAAEWRTGSEPEAPRNPDEIRETNVQAGAAETAAQTETAGSADDLKIIEGIGPSIAGILIAHGISTFHQLAGTPNERLVEILTEARLNRIADPGTWPEQARLAADGKWDELTQLQNTLKGGRRSE